MQRLPNHGDTALWLLTVSAVVTDNYGADNNIFVYQSSPRAGLGDRFAAVASAPQMRDLPAIKDEGSYYRHNIAVLLCRSAIELDATWAQLQSDVRLLVRDWFKLQSASQAESVDITPTSFTGNGAVTITTPPPADIAIIRYNDDYSRILLYNTSGVLIGEIPVLEHT